MRIIKLETSSVGTHEELANVLDAGGLVCVPCKGSYRITADLTNPDAVKRLFQSKRRTRKAPSLVFIDTLTMLQDVTDEISPMARRLVKAHWPGPLTILFRASDKLPKRVRKETERAVGKIGVRIPDDDISRKIIAALGRPLLVSSANRERREGASSPAQIRKNFVHRVDVFVDAGDLAASPSSTVVDIEGGEMRVTRAGAILEADLRRTLEG